MTSIGHIEFLKDRAERFSANQSAAVKARIYGNRLRYADYGSPAVAAPMPPKPKAPLAMDAEAFVEMADALSHEQRKGERLIIRRYAITPDYSITVKQILYAVAGAFGVSLGSLLSHAGGSKAAWPRYAAMKLMREIRAMSTPRIAFSVGKIDHTTVIYGLRRADEFHAESLVWRERYDHALASLGKRVA